MYLFIYLFIYLSVIVTIFNVFFLDLYKNPKFDITTNSYDLKCVYASECLQLQLVNSHSIKYHI